MRPNKLDVLWSRDYSPAFSLVHYSESTVRFELGVVMIGGITYPLDRDWMAQHGASELSELEPGADRRAPPPNKKPGYQGDSRESMQKPSLKARTATLAGGCSEGNEKPQPTERGEWLRPRRRPYRAEPT
jgi:hypothetical protein